MTCRSSAERCPVMRRCTKCGAVMPSRSLALQHQNGCASPVDPVLADAQHEHVRHEHRSDRTWYHK